MRIYTIITYPTIYTIVQINFIKILLYNTLLQKCYSRPHVGLLRNHGLVGAPSPYSLPVLERGSHDGVSNVTPQTRGSVDYPSTRGIQVDVGLPDATLENRAESPLYGELYPNTVPCINLHIPVPNNPIYAIYIKYGHLGP